MGERLTLDDLCVSRETVERLNVYAELLRRWQRSINLVAPSTLDDLERRHFADSAQVRAALPRALTWADLGSGAGFPGMVLAIQLCEAGAGLVHLIESDAKKCAFLREVARATGARAQIHRARIDAVVPALNVEGVTARALAPLPRLIAHAQPLLKKGATGVFLKGQDVEAELTEDPVFSTVNVELTPSRSDPKGRVAIIRWRP